MQRVSVFAERETSTRRGSRAIAQFERNGHASELEGRQRPADSLTEFVRLTSPARLSNNLRDAENMFPEKIIDVS